MADIHKIKTPATLMISGPSGCGKSTLLEQIISKLPEVFDRPPERVIFCFAREQALYDDIKQKSPVPVSFIKGLPDSLRPPARTLLVIDDLQNYSSAISDWFTKHAHHSDVDVAYLVQNLFLNTPHHRTCNLNTHVLCVFKNPRDKVQIMCLARQVNPENPKFIMSAFLQATQRPHGYLVLNLKQDTPEHLRIRDSFFTDAHFFVDKKGVGVVDLSS